KRAPDHESARPRERNPAWAAPARGPRAPRLRAPRRGRSDAFASLAAAHLGRPRGVVQAEICGRFGNGSVTLVIAVTRTVVGICSLPRPRPAELRVDHLPDATPRGAPASVPSGRSLRVETVAAAASRSRKASVTPRSHSATARAEAANRAAATIDKRRAR